MKTHRFIIVVVFISSFSSLCYEIVLTRIFSISLWYHYAFMVISIAMLGTGASGTLLSYYPKLKNTDYLTFYILILCSTIPISYLLVNNIPLEPVRLSWERIQLFYISIYYIILSIPFFFSGLIVSTSFSVLTEQTENIYGADLTGAGIGSLAALCLLSFYAPEKIIFIVSLISSFFLIFLSERKYKPFFIFIFICSLTVLFLNLSFANIRISAYKPFSLAMQFPDSKILKTCYSPFSRVDIFKSPAVRFAPGLSLKYTEELPQQTGLAIDAGDIFTITDPDDKKSLIFIEYLPSSLPYYLSERKNVLILEPKGGFSVLTARYFRSSNITNIDSNPLVIKSVREFLKKSSSNIYKNNTMVGLGRSILSTFIQKFDIIDISLMGSMPSGSFGISEDYRLTVEAFDEYLNHLKQDGYLSINLYIIPPPRTELRLVNIIAEAFERKGIRNFGDHIAAIRSWGTINILVKNSVLSEMDIKTIKSFANNRRFDLVYYPGISKKEININIKLPIDIYFHLFSKLVDSEKRKQFTEDYIFDIKAVHDENPFFNHYMRFDRIIETYRLMGEKWQFFAEEGYLLPFILIQVVILSLFLILLPAIKNKSVLKSFKFYSMLMYFLFIGIGFMFVEISLIHRLILPLENPSYAFAIVVSSILMSSGIGSILSHRYRFLKKYYIFILLSIVILFFSLSLPLLMQYITAYNLPVKIMIVFLLLAPAGMLMGIPFPLGMSLLASKKPSIIPWAWAINGCFSVIAPIIALMLALSEGFTAVMITGILMYIAALLMYRIFE